MKYAWIAAHIDSYPVRLMCELLVVSPSGFYAAQSRAGLGHCPRTILTELARIHAADIVLPLAQMGQRELRIRCVVRPERAQTILLERLGLSLPQRLKAPPMAQM